MSPAARPLVSVLIPTYNRAQALPKAVESVLRQDIADIELIIVDDGSMDHTRDVILKMQEQVDCIHYTRLEQNRGPGFARDIALRQAKGIYIGFIDSDDIWLPGKLKDQVAVLEAFPEIDMLFSDFLNVDSLKGATTKNFDNTKSGLARLQTRELSNQLFLVEGGFEAGLLEKNFIQLGTLLFRKTIVEKVGRFNPALVAAEDFEFCLRAGILGCRYAYLNKIHQQRFKNAASITANAAESWRCTLQALDYFRQSCIQLGRKDLLPFIAQSGDRACRNLILAHGKSQERKRALKAFLACFRAGKRSFKTTLALVTAMLGPWAIERAKAALRFRNEGQA